MTRIAVAKHLGLLEEAGLITTRRRGREKLHFLNRCPSGPSTTGGSASTPKAGQAGLVDLKQELEKRMEKVFEIYIRTTPERLWAAITDPTYAPGSTSATGSTRLEPRVGVPDHQPERPGSAGRGRNLEVDPPAGWSSPCSPCGARTSPRTGPPG
jgi:hypothetical protein